jgi:23S rRNA (pseudouridine1915-N3)-methyltransferase
MKISLIAVAKIKRGPERELISDYIGRAGKLGGALGVRDVSEIEVEAGQTREQECERLKGKIPDGARVFLFDETGRDWTSVAFSKELEARKDQGCPHMVFLIGGADGYTDEMKQAFPDKIRLGSLTWPHKLVRVLAAEQIYRALSLMAGTPYHRE